MTHPVHPFLRYLASWDRDESGFHAALDDLSLRPVRFSGVPQRHDDATECLAVFMVDPMAAVTEAPDGTLLLPGNPHEVLRQLVEERFAPRRHRRWRRLPPGLRRTMVRTRRMMHGRRRTVRLREPQPGEGLTWPDEPRVDRYRRALYEGLVEERFRPGGARGARGTHRHRAELLGAPWPERNRYAVAVSYEILDRDGLRMAGAVLEESVARGVRPCFYLAPRKALWDDALLGEIRAAGAEVGLYGLTPGDDLAAAKPRRLRKLLDHCTDWIERHEVVGYRNPTARVSSSLLQVVSERLEYDSSIPDTHRCPMDATRSGCAVTVPFWREALLELPRTIPTDEQLRDLGVVGLAFLEVIRAKIRAIGDRHGLATLAIRLEPGRGGSRVQRDLIGAALEELRDEGGAWIVPPREVAALWREAAAMPDLPPDDDAAPPSDHRL